MNKSLEYGTSSRAFGYVLTSLFRMVFTDVKLLRYEH